MTNSIQSRRPSFGFNQQIFENQLKIASKKCEGRNLRREVGIEYVRS